MEINIIPFDYRTKIPTVSGVYFFLTKDNKTILYIGSTNNLRWRVNTHTQFRETTNLAWLECKENIRKLERDLIRSYKPKYNIRNGNQFLLYSLGRKREKELLARFNKKVLDKQNNL
mgnify:CR=1 FL=1